jgi:hypothetical protein
MSHKWRISGAWWRISASPCVSTRSPGAHSPAVHRVPAVDARGARPNQRQEVSRRTRSPHLWSEDTAASICRSRRPAPRWRLGRREFSSVPAALGFLRHVVPRDLRRMPREGSDGLGATAACECRVARRGGVHARAGAGAVRSYRRDLANPPASLRLSGSIGISFLRRRCGAPRRAAAGQGAEPLRHGATSPTMTTLCFGRGAGTGSMVQCAASSVADHRILFKLGGAETAANEITLVNLSAILREDMPWWESVRAPERSAPAGRSGRGLGLRNRIGAGSSGL